MLNLAEYHQTVLPYFSDELAGMERERFRSGLENMISHLESWNPRPSEKELSLARLKDQLSTEFSQFLPEEQSLFYNVLDLFALSHRIGSLNETLGGQLEISPGKCIGFIGPLGVAKSTLAKILIDDLKADFVVKEPYEANPFWGRSQINPNYMLRSQVYFLLSNIFSDMKAKIKPGIAVSDTSTLSDIFMWADWYHEIGKLSDSEYRTYQRLITLLRPIIPKPNLLVTLVPDSIRNLCQGIRERAANEPTRVGELVFTEDELQLQTERAIACTERIAQEWDVPVLQLIVNPISIYKAPHLYHSAVDEVRRVLL